ncbi:FKBP-type peptidyl-prolyl cis-trans isomerase [uncultured Flavobacterium sp.]|uniref:FKBP-type peptidyl-prolyl cis-trans isomerase n=1 Tax=uncultured Flavobacterium sp. TaxID=165435 RepID=UPI0029311346|nr:FKBP-type peptidyl-prolyl cis-trans isomerase [uncultured Flavobacterium sp.]
MKYLLSTIFVMTLFISCTSDAGLERIPEIKDYTVQNEKEITDYIAKNKLTAQRTSSGLYYVINEPGTGTQPTSTSNVTVAYKGYYTDGKIFDQSKDTGISFGLNQVIKGWTEGIPYFKAGGSGILLIPSHLGYGPLPYNGIPGGSVLIFDVKLLSVN